MVAVAVVRRKSRPSCLPSSLACAPVLVVQIVSAVLGGRRLELPPADQLPGFPVGGPPDGLQSYVDLMERCWAQDPQKRPTFDQIIPELRALLAQAGGAGAASSSGGADYSTPSLSSSSAALSGGSAGRV